MNREMVTLPDAKPSVPALVVPPSVSKKRFIYEAILNRIQSKELPEGTRLPSTSVLAAEWQLAYATVQSALNDLTREGWLIRNPKLGTFVSIPKRKPDPAAQTTAVIVLPPRADIIRSGNGDAVFDMLQGVIETGQKCGWKVRIESIPTRPTQSEQETAIDSIRKAAVGLFIGTQYYQVIRGLTEESLPVMTLGSDPGIGHAVTYHREVAVQMAVDHLVAQGCKRIGFLGNTEDSSEIGKFPPFLERLREHGLESEKEDCFHYGSAPEAKDVATRFFESGAECEAVFVTNYRIACALAQEARLRGCCIPEDLAIVGLGIAPSTPTGIPLTYIRVPFFEFGTEALRWIASVKTDLPKQKRRIMNLLPELVAGETT